MKKKILLVLCSLLLISGCDMFKEDFSDKYVYTTMYPIEYATKELYKDYANISSVYPNGADITFEVTDSHGDKSYVLIKRYTVDGYFKYTREQRPVVAAEFYFDKERDYDDFDLTLKIIYKNGTTKSVVMQAQENFEDALGNPVGGYETDEEACGGKGLKQAYFEYGLEDGEIDTIDKMYINAEYKGSTASNYAGAYVGSGEGVAVWVYTPEGGE